PRMHDQLFGDLGSKALDVGRRQLVADPVHATPPVTATDDRHQLARVLEVVGGDELDQWMLRGASAEECDNVLAIASPGVLADRLSESDLNGTLGPGGAHQ